ncbi:hypothetical protein [Lentzea kentuckyensis]|jgi:hypothetical protein|uniref:hypothetical protein n=1 Tax=Lentzea kentuckyensis TaxID=360086 RepID=UPI000A390BD2|nr:hypothetical protein [Lentzea kentuckyensis]
MGSIGDLMNDHRPVCGHADTLEHPKCGRPAAWHVLIDDADMHGLTSLAACPAHVTVARSCGNVLQQHAYDGVCGMPGTLWNPDSNRCELDGTGVSRNSVAVSHG